MTWVGLVPFVESMNGMIASGGFMPQLMLQGPVFRLRPYTRPILVVVNMKTPDVTLSILSVFTRKTSRMIPHGPHTLCNKGLRGT
jgi:hypothetical protein